MISILPAQPQQQAAKWVHLLLLLGLSLLGVHANYVHGSQVALKQGNARLGDRNGEGDDSHDVVEAHPVVASGINKLVTGCTLKKGGVEMEPMASNVDSHGELKEKHEGGVEGGESREETHCGAPVCQHIQHRAKLATQLLVHANQLCNGCMVLHPIRSSGRCGRARCKVV